MRPAPPHVRRPIRNAPRFGHAVVASARSSSDPALRFSPPQAGRKNKEAARLADAEAEESARRETDRAEAAARAAARRARIERANRKLYDETDRVKSFHSSLLLSDVLKEREAQIEHKKLEASVRAKHDAQFVNEQRRAAELASAAETRKAAERKSRALRQRDDQLAQLEELRDHLRAERDLDRLEGAMIKRQAEEEAAAKAADAAAAKARAAADAAATAAANDALRAYREREAEREREQDRKIEEFARQKERMANARKMHEQAKRDEAQRRRDRIVSIMEADLLRRRAEQTARHHAEAEAAEAAHEEREAIKAAERAHELEMIDRSRQQQFAIRAAERARAEAEDAAFARQWKLRNEELRREEEEEKATARARAKTLQRAHVRQIQKKLAKAEAARDAEWMDTMRAERALAEDDELFKHYADACMEEWAAQGKSLRPMQYELAKPRDKVTF